MRPLPYLVLLALFLIGAGQSFADSSQPCLPDDSAPAVCAHNPLLHRKRIAVVDFTVPPVICCGCGPDSGTIAVRLSGLLSDMFISELTNSGAFDVIERSELDKVLNEQRLGHDALLNPATAPRLRQILGVDMILGGTLTEFGVKQQRRGALAALTGIFGLRLEGSTARVVIDTRLIDTSTAQILLTDTACAENSEHSLSFAGANPHQFLIAGNVGTREWAESRIGRATRAAVNEIACRLIAHFPVEASVAAVLPDNSAILNIGCFAGIRIGNIFDLVQISQVLDPTSGSVIYEGRKEARHPASD